MSGKSSYLCATCSWIRNLISMDAFCSVPVILLVPAWVRATRCQRYEVSARRADVVIEVEQVAFFLSYQG
jgi:hypothetical protein